ncbi:MAG: trypsin-like peptidase domain-containing protein, partial [Bacteriovoracaceae bacterium]|nr:trypsin-like peptidase domain-containing protein [Bacteriovoracaceae bacterium]
MKKLSTIVPILFTLLFLASCEDKVENCSEAFVSSYNTVKSSYLDTYSKDSTEEQKQALVNDLQFFLNEYATVKCKLEGKEIEPGEEMKSLLSLLNKKEKSFEKYIPKVIYGDDDRIDVPDSSSDLLKLLASSTAAMVEGSKLGSDLTLPTETLGESFNLCPGEKFAEQINPAVCSGFLVRSDVLVTAGHCIQTQSDCNSYKWVFGFYKGVSKLSENQVYSCKNILKTVVNSKSSGDGADFAVIQLDRKVEGRRPLKFRSSGQASDGDPIVVIGHPSGLPTKIAGGANIRSGESAYFTANLDTFGGNSGSAVFNATTGEVEGILVRGALDYVTDVVDGRSCKRVNKCSNDGCDGE